MCVFFQKLMGEDVLAEQTVRLNKAGCQEKKPVLLLEPVTHGDFDRHL